MLGAFITFKDKEKFYVLQTAFPHYIGEVTRGGRPVDPIFTSKVSGYNIWITFSGALEANRILIADDWKDNMKRIINDMGDFYLAARIDPEPKKFKLWRDY